MFTKQNFEQMSMTDNRLDLNKNEYKKFTKFKTILTSIKDEKEIDLSKLFPVKIGSKTKLKRLTVQLVIILQV